MNIFQDNHIHILKKLITSKVEFMIIGGYAVNFYGYRRGTGDLDIWIKPDNPNKLRLLECFKLAEIEDADIEYLESLDFSTTLAFHIDEEPDRLDFLTKVSGVNWDDAWEQHQNFEIDGLIIPIIHKNHLIDSKKSTGRKQDLADIEGLENNNSDSQ